jgi:hypothetical protein
LGTFPTFGQRSKRLDCPIPGKQRSYRGRKPVTLELGTGIGRPLLYRNGAGETGENYKFAALAIPYLRATVYLYLNERVEAFAGLAATQTWQGLGFHFSNGAGSRDVWSYAGSFLFSLPVGIRYRISPALQFSAGPYVSTSYHGSSPDTQSRIADLYTYAAPRDAYRINGGLLIGAEVNLSRGLSAVLSCSVDVGQSTASYSTADMRDEGGKYYQGAMEPYLLHPALGISYRLRPND